MQRYAIIDSQIPTPGTEAASLSEMEQWVAGGVEWVQLRARDLPRDRLDAWVRKLAALARAPGSGTRLLVNLRSGLTPREAVALGAHGVHLGSGALAEEVRGVVAEAGLVSVSCHTLAEVRAAREGGATLVLWAPVFGKVVGDKEIAGGTGLALLGAACREAAPVPVFALGGVSAENAAACVEAGAAGIAGVRLFAGEGWRALR